MLGGVARVYLGLGTTRMPEDAAFVYFLFVLEFLCFIRIMNLRLNSCSNFT